MIYIIRHGQTELNTRRVLQGRSDYPLNETGISQAEAARKKLENVSFSRVYSSPLIRAVQTAGIIVPHLKPSLDRRLIEMDYGPYEGMSLKTLAPEVLTFFSDFNHNPAPDGMETLESVVDRAQEFMMEMCRTGETVLISTHAIAMKGILEFLTPESHGSYWTKYIGNCSIFGTSYRNGTFSVPFEID